MKGKPRLSVIIGIYNCTDPGLLDNAVGSILEQTYSDFEVILCDDGSTDNGRTRSLLEAIKLRDRRVKVIGYPCNRGLAYALNAALETCEGEYVARHDADDIAVQDRFEQQLAYLDRHPEIDFVGSFAYLYDDAGRWGKLTVPRLPKRSDFLWNSPFLHPTVVFRRKSLLDCGMYRVSEETARCEDYDLFMRMYSQGYIGANLPELLLEYRQDRREYKHRSFKDRLHEVKVRQIGFNALGFGRKRIPYILKPLVVGVMPDSVLRQMKKLVGIVGGV